MICFSWFKFDAAGVAHALDFFCGQGIDFPPDFIGKKNSRRVSARANRVEFFCVARAVRFDVHNKTTDDSNGIATPMFQYFCLDFVAESERKIFDFCFLYVHDSLLLSGSVFPVLPRALPMLARRTLSVGQSHSLIKLGHAWDAKPCWSRCARKKLNNDSGSGPVAFAYSTAGNDPRRTAAPRPLVGPT